MLSERPNEPVNEDRNLGADAETASLAIGGDTNPTTPRPPIRWVQLAYDLEHYGDRDPDERGEVF